MGTTFDLAKVFEKKFKESYQKQVENGYKGTYQEWLDLRRKESEREAVEEKNKEEERKRIESLPENIIFKSHDHHNSLLPINWNSKTFENMKVEKNSRLEKIVNILKEQTLDDCGFWLSGGVGCGKSHILLATFNLLSFKFLKDYGNEVGLNIKYYNYSDLCSILREDPNDFEKFQKIRSPYFLFIDDIGVSKNTDFIQEKIYSLFNYRVEQGLQTFVSTNLNLSEIQAEFNDRMVSRIKESSAWIDMSDIKDYRSNFIGENMKRFKEIIK